jgi:transcriptional regulator with XRE-family HTH domain
MAKVKGSEKLSNRTHHSPSGRPPLKEDLKTASGAPTDNVRSLEKSIGSQVRRNRKVADLTVAELSSAAGISTGMLSKIENGQISPSLSSLQAITKALNMPLSSLFASHDEQRACSYVQAGKGVAIKRRGTKIGHDYELLGQSPGGDIMVEPYLIRLSRDAEPYTGFEHEGVEFIYMLTGEVVYAHAGRTYHLKPGDSILFDSGALHGPQELLDSEITYLSIIIYNRR